MEKSNEGFSSETIYTNDEQNMTIQAVCIGRLSIQTFHRMTCRNDSPCVIIMENREILFSYTAIEAYELTKFHWCELFLSNDKKTIGISLCANKTSCSFYMEHNNHTKLIQIQSCSSFLKRFRLEGLRFPLYGTSIQNFLTFNIGD